MEASALIDGWFRHFGTSPTTPRRVLSRAIDEDPTFLAALATTLNDFHPATLSRWLRRNENRPFLASTNNPYRFTYTQDRLWRLTPSPSLVGQE